MTYRFFSVAAVAMVAALSVRSSADAVVTYTVTFNTIVINTPASPQFKGQLFGTLKNSKTSLTGAITCIGRDDLFYLTAILKVGTKSRFGNFRFSSQEVCVQTGNAIAAKPGKAVRFILTLDEKGRMNGQVVEVLW